jgi:hypothetical protein
MHDAQACPDGRQPEAEAHMLNNQERPQPNAAANAATPFVVRFASVVDWIGLRRGYWPYHCSWLAVRVPRGLGHLQ